MIAIPTNIFTQDDPRTLRMQFLKTPDTHAICAGGGVEIPILDTRVSGVAPYGSATITSPGNMECIQLALDCSGGQSTGDSRDFTTESSLLFYRDGESTADVQMNLGHLFCRYGTSLSPTPTVWHSEDIGLDENDFNFFGAFRNLFVPFTSSLRVTFKSGAASQGQVGVYSHLAYRLGNIPQWLGGPGTSRNVLRQSRLGTLASPWQTVAGLASVDLVNYSGAGELESVTLAVASGSTAAITSSIEGHVVTYIDGVAVVEYGGTEDNFGNHFYADEIQARDKYWGCACIGNACNSSTIGSVNGSSWYRKWSGKKRNPFTTALRQTWTNGDSGVGNPGSVSIACNVLHYTK